MEIGSYVEIRYEGKNAGKVLKGHVRHFNQDGSLDIDMESPSWGMKFSVPSSIVHPVQVDAAFQKRMNNLLPVKSEEQ